MNFTRRRITGLILGAPAAAAAVAVTGLQQWLGFRPAAAAQSAAEPAEMPAPAEPEESALGKFLARHEEGLSSEERRLVRRDVAQLEQSLGAIRDFKLGNDVPPAGTFIPVKSKR